jgi:NTE family protein
MARKALVLSGGGSKGAYQVGAIQALLEFGHSWDAVYGISVGALNAGWLAMYKPEDQYANFGGLREIWNAIKTSNDIYEPWAPFYLNYIASLWKGSLNSGKPLRRIVTKFFDIERARASGVKLSVGCCSLTTSRYHAFDQTNPNILEYILASSHLPVIFEPLLIEGQVWVDGGIRHQIPILDALKDEPEHIDVIVTQPITNYDVLSVPNKTFKSAIGVSLRGAAIFSDQVYFADCMNVLRIIKDEGKKSPLSNTKKVNFFVPSSLPNKDSMNFDGKVIQKTIEMGYRETIAKLQESK